MLSNVQLESKKPCELAAFIMIARAVAVLNMLGAVSHMIQSRGKTS